MTSPQDLSKLRINRDDPPAPVRRAFRRVLMFAGIAIIVVVAVLLTLRRGTAVPVQIFAVSLGSTGGGGGQPVSVVANGYVVARTKASVSAKIAGRLAYLGVSEGSVVRRGDVIARLDNADYDATVAEAEAQLATARATLIEAESERDHLRREFHRLRDIRTQNIQLISEQEVELAESRFTQGNARANAQAARANAAAAGVRVARANLENTFIATLLLGFGIAIALAVASGIIPALRAARLPIVQALRHVG